MASQSTHSSTTSVCRCPSCARKPFLEKRLLGSSESEMDENDDGAVSVVPDLTLELNANLEHEAITAPQVIALLTQMKTWIVRENRLSCEAVKKDLLEKISALSETTNRVYTCVSSASYDYRSQSSFGSSGKKRLDIPSLPLGIPFQDMVANPEVGTVHLVKFLFIATVYSFVQDSAVPNLACWLTPQALSAEDMVSFKGVSGLSLLFFANLNRDAKSRLRSPAGKACGQLAKMVIAKKITSGKHSFGVHAGPNCQAPDWMLSFKGSSSTMKIVSDILGDSEKVKDVRSESSTIAELDTAARGAKRQRISATAREAASRVDDLGAVRKHVVRSAKSRLLRWLSTNRCEARKKLFVEVMFLVEHIHSFKTHGGTVRASADLAKEKGFEIVFSADTDEVLNDIESPEFDSGSIWGIPLSTTDESDPVATRQENIDKFKSMKAAFPCLTVRLKYQKQVVRLSTDVSDGSAEWSDSELTWPASENVSLHALASRVILAAIKVDTFEDVMKASKYSLRAVHILAIGLLGVLRRAMGINLTQAEEAAKGSVKAQPQMKNDNLDTLLYGGGTKEKDGDADCKSALQRMRTEKLQMGWSEFVVEREKNRLPGPENRSSVIMSSNNEGEPASKYWAWADE